LGVSGEIYIGGEAVGRGYLNRPALTAERFVRDRMLEPDVECTARRHGEMVAGWRLQFQGRTDFQVKIRGHRIELEEIEAKIAEHEEVREAVVLARHDACGRPRLVVYYTSREEGTELDGRNIAIVPVAKLPEYMVPACIYAAGEAAVERQTGSWTGRRCRRRRGSLRETNYEAPQTQTEVVVAGIWSEVLNLERVGRRDNFFELGATRCWRSS